MKPALVLLALAGVLLRDSEGRLLTAWYVSAGMQLPALAAWMIRQFGAGRRAGTTGLTQILTIVVLAGSGVLGVIYGSGEVFFVGMTAFIFGQAMTAAAVRLYAAMEARIEEPIALAWLLARAWIVAVIVLTALLAIPLGTQSSVPDYRHNFWLHVVSCGQSAASVLGLIGVTPYSLSEDFTVFGRWMLVAATHLAGLGFAGMGLSIIRPILTRNYTLRFVYIVWSLLHAAGAIALWYTWGGGAAGNASRGWWGLVYATSALANSGLSMGPEGLMNELSHPVVFLVITILCLAGSLGLPMLLELAGVGRGRMEKSRDAEIGPLGKVLTWEAGTTFLLLALAAGMLFLFETPRFLSPEWVPSRPVSLGSRLQPLREEAEHGQRWRTSVFVSVALRSAGLQCISLSEGAVSWPTYGLLMMWMLIGGSASGVAGGFRCTAIVLLSLVLLHRKTSWGMSGGLARVRQRTLRGVTTYVVGWAAVNGLCVGGMALLTNAPSYEWVFEPIAVMNGVGLSTGLSLHLTGWGRLAMIGMMFIGRWGPIAYWAWWSQSVSRTLSKRTPSGT